MYSMPVLLLLRAGLVAAVDTGDRDRGAGGVTDGYDPGDRWYGDGAGCCVSSWARLARSAFFEFSAMRKAVMNSSSSRSTLSTEERRSITMGPVTALMDDTNKLNSVRPVSSVARFDHTLYLRFAAGCHSCRVSKHRFPSGSSKFLMLDIFLSDVWILPVCISHPTESHGMTNTVLCPICDRSPPINVSPYFWIRACEMLVVLFLIVASVASLIFFILHPYLSVLFWLLYVVTYFNQPERTGRWSLDWLRGLSMWKKLSSCEMAHPKMLDEHPPTKRLLFLVAPNSTMIPMFWSFGLHGSESLRELDVVFTVPRVLLYIPLLRDLLLMSGAVANDFDTVKRLLSKGRAVCTCTSGAQAYLLQDVDATDTSTVMAIPDELAAFCVDQGVHVAPVLFLGETNRYRVAKPPRLDALQKLMYREIGYTFPLTFMLHPEVPITTVVGSPISPRPYKETSDYRGFVVAVHGAWRGIGNVDDHTIIIKSWQH